MRMLIGALRYSVGNENDPGDPWGRSELSIQPDGAARLEHHFSRHRSTGVWAGQVESAALQALWNALQLAGFPARPPALPVAGAAMRRLVIETGDGPQRVDIAANVVSSLAGYAEAFDILDGLVRQLSGETVTYPTTQPLMVHDVIAEPIA
jgi:hypothetical protein